jgi:MFS family permease
MTPTFQALEVRNYRIYAMGSLVSNTGTWMQRVAQDWLVLQLTHSGSALGITTGLQFLPFLILTPFAGVLADRMSKRRLLIFTQASLAVSAGLLGLLAVTGSAQVWHVFVLAFLFGCGTSFDTPARQSFVVEMVGRDQLANAVGLNSASFNVGRIVGPAIAGFTIAALGSGVQATGVAILVNAVSYLAVIYSLRQMDPHALQTAAPVAKAKGAVRDGARYVRANPDLVFVFIIAFFAGTFGMNFQMTSALMATGVFHKGAGEYGILGTFMAIGSLTGALLAARRASARRMVLVLATASFGIAEIAAGLMPAYWMFAAWLPVMGICAITMMNALQTTVQMTVDSHMRGRVMALYMMILMGGTPVGAPVIGWIGETFGARWTLIGGGSATLLAVIGATIWVMRKQDIHVSELSVHPAKIAA